MAVVLRDPLGEVRVVVDVDVEALAQVRDPRVRDRLSNEDLHTAVRSYVSSARLTAAAALDVGAQLAEHELDAGQRGRDVEDVEPADVADAEDLALDRALAARERDAEPVAQRLEKLGAVDSGRHLDRGHDGRAVVVGREELEPHRLRSLAAGAAEANVAFEGSFEAVLEQQPERDVERDDERDGRGERRVQLRLRLAIPLPVEVVEPARRGRRRPLGDPARTRAPAASSGPSATRPATTSMAHSSVSSGTAPRLEIASTTESAPASCAAAASARTSATTPVEVSEWVRNTALAPPSSPQPRGQVLGGGHLAPLVVDHVDLAAVRPGDLLPPLAEVARPRRRRRGRPAPARFATADSIAPVPEAVNSSGSPAVR